MHSLLRKHAIFLCAICICFCVTSLAIKDASATTKKGKAKYTACVKKANKLSTKAKRNAAIKLCKKALAAANAPAAFAITSVARPDALVINQPSIDFKVTYTGKPTFPLKINYYPKNCPGGLQCTFQCDGPPDCITPGPYLEVPYVYETFDKSNPLTLPKAAYCFGPPSLVGFFFDFAMTITDAKGIVTPSFDAGITCGE